MEPQKISVQHMFLNADPVVQGVMLILLLASLACWVIIFEKAMLLHNAAKSVRLFRETAANTPLAGKEFCTRCPSFTSRIAEAGVTESRDNAGRESREAYRERVERAMRTVLAAAVDRLGRRTPFLATVGSTAPFIGLFGTVWGIMNSFIGIAASGETSLAIVAPGIAEALFATAMGLVAAIPAVMGFNKISAGLKAVAKEGISAIGLLGNRLARDHFSRDGE